MKNIRILCDKRIPAAASDTNGFACDSRRFASVRKPIHPVFLRPLNSMHNNPLDYFRVVHIAIRDGHYGDRTLTSKFPTPSNKRYAKHRRNYTFSLD